MVKYQKVLLIAAVWFGCLNVPAQEQGSVKPSTRPVSFGIVVDNSGSYRLLLERVINFTHSVAEKLNDGDEAFLVTFVDPAKTRLRQELTSDKRAIYEAIDNMFVEGGSSAVLDAVHFSLDHLATSAKISDGRGLAILLISDGDDRVSGAKLESIITTAKESNVRIVVVGISDEKLNMKLLDRLAKGTGGTAFYPKTSKETLAIKDEVVRALRGN
jgi:Mg-chelatase subunit ChlD